MGFFGVCSGPQRHFIIYYAKSLFALTNARMQLGNKFAKEMRHIFQICLSNSCLVRANSAPIGIDVENNFVFNFAWIALWELSLWKQNPVWRSKLSSAVVGIIWFPYFHTQWYIFWVRILLPIWVHFWARILLLKVIYGLFGARILLWK